MGVTGLWDVVKPVARPVKLETLNRKRLAVDASIWIYQFLKAVRDKEGNALRNSHVVGFFRRICKLLFFGIKPVFVFDGGAPILKRQTISHRKARREGRREDMVRTAGKLLAKQMQHRAEEDERKRRQARDRSPVQEELPDELVYVEEQLMTPEQKRQNRRFKKKDAYHLPELDSSLNEMGQPNDPRIMSQAELEEYARQFHEGEDINLYDFSKIDFDGPFFTSLPATDRYNILNAARLRSRLRMGYSAEQLNLMFPNRMDFSRFQIERVKERNELTQRLMNLNGMNDELGSGRVAGEKGKEYVLVQNEGADGGWALGVVSNKDEGKREKPIDIDKPMLPLPIDEESDDSFEDVPIEGLNRLPKRPKYQAPPDADPSYAVDDAQMQEALFNDSLQQSNTRGTAAADEDDTLFVPADETMAGVSDDDGQEFEDVPMPNGGDTIEEEELQRAIAMSLQEDSGDEQLKESQRAGDVSRAERLRKETAANFSAKHRASGRNFANYANARAAKLAPRSMGTDASTNPELRAAFEAGRKMGPRQKQQDQARPTSKATETPSALEQPSKFKGPLPFESIDLGKSLFTKKKAKPVEAEEGGFEKEKENRPRTPPPWFSGGFETKEDYERGLVQAHKDGLDEFDGARGSTPILRRHKTDEVIDLDNDELDNKEPIDLLSSDDDEQDVSGVGMTRPLDTEVRMGDIADLARAEPPVSEIAQGSANHSEEMTQAQPARQNPSPPANKSVHSDAEEAETLEWEESDVENPEQYRQLVGPAGGEDQKAASTTPSPEPEFENTLSPQLSGRETSADPDFEDVEMPNQERLAQKENSPLIEEVASHANAAAASGEATGEDVAAIDDDFDNYFSDPEDEDLMKQLADEAEEHARFAAQLNVATGLQTAADYEKELKQLRNQQKAERRDADEVTQVMITECQQLLRLFGLPYITAPMEAEAQCAELHKLGLVDGIVTDDSDIFLFGGSRVYKNMFNQAKEVQCYIASDLEKEYGLGREKIIQIAQLLGSDYTEGIPNVGPVTALEILTEFGTLEAFQSWWTDVQTGMAPPDPKGFKKKFRKNATKIFLPPGFPDPRVDAAYLKPEVDSDASEFQWGVPDLDALRQYLMATIGWSQDRTDEILVPVVRDINRRETEGTQANITRFFGSGAGTERPAVGGSDAYAPRRRQEGRSSRMENALGKLHEQTRRAAGGVVADIQENEGDVEEPVKETAAKKRKAPAEKGRIARNTAPADDEETKNEESEEDEYQPKSAARGKKRRTRTPKR